MHHKINDETFRIKDQIPDTPGIYKIIVLDQNDLPIKINRFLDVDSNGILYIGKANNLRKRLANMRRAFSITHKSKKHIAVRRYYLLKKVADKYPIDRIVVLIEKVKDCETAKHLETKRLEEYEKIFGERPPFNKQ